MRSTQRLAPFVPGDKEERLRAWLRDFSKRRPRRGWRRAAVADWCRFNTTTTVFIELGSPWQNAWIESFNGRLRDELLNGELFDNLLEARVVIENWRIDYNQRRPH